MSGIRGMGVISTCGDGYGVPRRQDAKTVPFSAASGIPVKAASHHRTRDGLA